MEKESVTFKIAITTSEQQQGLREDFGLRGFPTNVLIGPDRKVARRWLGFRPEELRAELARLGMKK